MKQERPPVVTILGHVDHGKTTLLDFVRQSAVAKSEHGGITQAIGAYQTNLKDKIITFIDTPGHVAFEKMRSRGALMADIAVLVVAVDDGVMPQTVEAIKHIQGAGIPMIVAVNKTDLPEVNIKVQLEKIKKQLADQKVLVEEYGGETPLVALSAKTGEKVPELLETINLVAEIHELRGDSEKLATGVVIEAHLDKHTGPVATVLVRDGSLKKGEEIKVGNIASKVRGMFDFEGHSVEVALPSQPIEVLGFSEVPPIGMKFGEIEGNEEAIKRDKLVTSLIDQLKENEAEILKLIVKADTQGSLEAIETIVDNFNADKLHIKLLSSGTGDISDSDIELAIGTHAIVIGFNIKVLPTALKMAETGHILVRIYNVIYELSEELKDVIAGILKPGKVEEVFGRAQIIAEFAYGKLGRVAGCKILEGTFSKGPKVRIVRGEEIVGETKIKSLRKVKEEVTKVEKGNECGMIFDPSLDFQMGDLVESFRLL